LAQTGVYLAKCRVQIVKNVAVCKNKAQAHAALLLFFFFLFPSADLRHPFLLPFQFPIANFLLLSSFFSIVRSNITFLFSLCYLLLELYCWDHHHHRPNHPSLVLQNWLNLDSNSVWLEGLSQFNMLPTFFFTFLLLVLFWIRIRRRCNFRNINDGRSQNNCPDLTTAIAVTEIVNGSNRTVLLQTTFTADDIETDSLSFWSEPLLRRSCVNETSDGSAA